MKSNKLAILSKTRALYEFYRVLLESVSETRPRTLIGSVSVVKVTRAKSVN